MMTLRKRHRRRDRSLQSLAPGSTLPTPPAAPAAVHVSSVRTTAEASVALWVFNENIDNPTSAVTGFVAGSGGGHGGLAWERANANSLKIEHNFPVTAGDPWSNTDAAGGIRSTDGGELQAGSGIVSNP
jgi:hypothetical protein